ncbi:MAG: MoaD/ThiS family protein [Candidatus Aminicenantes bacterium]|nr:MoaD/ThiS family protein [Candidatus Aminicenantes bacterium]
MRIRVYAPRFADHTKIDDAGFVTMPDGATLNDLLKTLRMPLRFATVLFCLVNYEKASLSRVLEDGDTVGFLALVSGG